MDGPVITIAGQQLRFGADGNVTDNSTGNVLGTWTSVSDPGDNKIRYGIGGTDQTPLTANYSFGSDLDNVNQLQVQLATADGSATSDTSAFVGGIEIDQDHKLNYFLVDNTGARTGVSLTLYGDLNFSQADNNLVVKLAGGGTVEIQGLGADGFLQAEQKDLAEFSGEDLLEFKAQTTNMFPGSTSALLVDAVIKFYGNWDIQDGKLVFMSNIQTSTTGAQVKIGFGGQLKGVTLGFAYFSGDGNTQLALNITGQHVFKSGADLTWSSSIGYTGKTFDATVDVTADVPIGNNKLTLTGKLTLKNSDGTNQGNSLDLNLQAEYSFDTNGILKFTAVVDADGPTPSYDLQLSGTFQYSNLNLTFSADFNDRNGQAITVRLGIQGDRDSILQYLHLAFDYTPEQATAALSLSFSARVTFADGIKTVTKTDTPAAIATGQGAGGGISSGSGPQSTS
jgi:hypothetical protein